MKRFSSKIVLLVFKQIVLWLSVLISLYSAAQNREIDSLQLRLSLEKEADSKVNIYNQLSKKYRLIDLSLALEYSKKAYELSNTTNFTQGLAESELQIGTCYYLMSEMDSAISYFKKAISVAEKHDFQDIISSSHANLGLVYFAQGDLDKALELQNNSLQIELTKGDLNKQLKRYNNIAAIYTSKLDYMRAIDYFFKSLDIAQKLNDQRAISYLLNNIGKNYDFVGQHDKALVYYEEALSKGKENGAFFNARLTGNIADTYAQKGDFDKALNYYKKGVSLAVSDDHICPKTELLIGISRLFLKIDKPDSALIYALKASEYATQCEHINLKALASKTAGRAYMSKGNLQAAEEKLLAALKSKGHQNLPDDELLQNLSELYEIKGNYPKALHYYKLYKQRQDSTFNEWNIKKIARIELEHQFEKNRTLLIAEQEKDKALLEQQISNFKVSRNYFIAGLLLFIILAYFLYVSYRKKESDHKILEEKNRTILNQQEELLAKAELLRDSNIRINELSQFKEGLAHMAVHDMKNPLNTVMGLSMGEPSAEKMKIIHRSSTQMLNFITNMLDIYKFEKASVVLELKKYRLWDLIEEAEQQLQMFFLEKDITLVKAVDKSIMVTIDEVIFVRVLVNLFSNAIKYSEIGSSIYIASDYICDGKHDKILKLTVVDQGKGIAESQLPRIFEQFNKNQPQHITKSASTGIGLSFCKLAIKAHKGNIELRSQLGKGTSIIISLPLEQDNYKEPCIQEKQILKPESNRLILEEEIELIKDYAAKLRSFKVHQVGRINVVLREMDKHSIKSIWKHRVRSAIYSGDSSAFYSLMDKAGLAYDEQDLNSR